MGTLLTTDIRKEKVDYRDALNLKIHMLRTPVLNSCPAVGSSFLVSQSEWNHDMIRFKLEGSHGKLVKNCCHHVCRCTVGLTSALTELTDISDGRPINIYSVWISLITKTI